LSITDTLDELGIENAAIQMEKDKLQDMPKPFLAHLNGNGGSFAMVNTRDKPENQFPGFFDRWGGVVVAAEKPENWQHKLNSQWLQKDKKQLAAVAATLLLLTAFILLVGVVSFNWLQAGLLLVAIAGVFISWMIVSKELGIENKLADQVCGKEADCNAVINSKTARLLLGIDWSDAGIIYFSYLLLALVISSFTETSDGLYTILSVLPACAIPVTLFSIYYQWRVIKKWCRLCLITAGLLWVQFFVLLPETVSLTKGGFNNVTLNPVLLTSFLLFITTAAWLWLKPLLKEKKKLETENFAGKRFKRNANVFMALLEKQRKINITTEGLGIVLGNPEAANTMVKVCNPYCGPCAKAHTVIDELLKTNGNVKVQIIFTAADDEKDKKAPPVKHLMALNDKNDTQLMQQALDDWYLAEIKDYEAFAAKYMLNGELETQGEKLKAMKAWCDEVKIDFTPTFFINGYQLPKDYNIEEVKYFLTSFTGK
jgi:uncharacterized membrane protein